MIEQGGMTIIKDKQGQPQTYRCVRLENGNAVLRNVLNDGAGGKPLIIPIEECPYVEDNVLITPKKEEYVREKPKTTLNLSKLIKQNTELRVSRSARYFLAEWLETALLNILANAEENALNKGSKTISAAHVFWLETNTAPNGFWPEHEEYMK